MCLINHEKGTLPHLTLKYFYHCISVSLLSLILKCLLLSLGIAHRIIPRVTRMPGQVCKTGWLVRSGEIPVSPSPVMGLQALSTTLGFYLFSYL